MHFTAHESNVLIEQRACGQRQKRHTNVLISTCVTIGRTVKPVNICKKDVLYKNGNQQQMHLKYVKSNCKIFL